MTKPAVADRIELKNAIHNEATVDPAGSKWVANPKPTKAPTNARIVARMTRMTKFLAVCVLRKLLSTM
jgi:hypothetical protein